MNCTKCGTSVPEGTKFCPNCGTNTTIATVTKVTTHKTKSQGIPKNMLFLIIAVIAIIIIVITAVLLSGGSRKAPADMSVKDAIAQGYPVVCQLNGIVDGMPRNFDVFFDDGKYASYNRDTENAIVIFNGTHEYAYDAFEGTWGDFTEDTAYLGLLDPVRFYEGYVELVDYGGIDIACKYVSEIKNEAFVLPAGANLVTSEGPDMSELDELEAIVEKLESLPDEIGFEFEMKEDYEDLSILEPYLSAEEIEFLKTALKDHWEDYSEDYWGDDY